MINKVIYLHLNQYVSKIKRERETALRNEEVSAGHAKDVKMLD